MHTTVYTQKENQKNIFVVGDTHKILSESLTEKIRNFDIRDSILLGLGDHATGFFEEPKQSRIFRYQNNYFSRRNNQWFEVRSNHANAKYFDGSVDLSHFHLVPDNSILEFNNKRFIFLGGAISIDRQLRKEGKDYWRDENFVLNEEKLNAAKNIDYVIAHSNPEFCHPLDKSGIREYLVSDDSLLDDVNKERKDLATAYEILSRNNEIKGWFNGHYHLSHLEIINKTKFRTLAIDEFYEIR